MGTRTVRLDEEAERALEEIMRSTGLSVSAALKQGLSVLREEIARSASVTPYEVFEKLDLGDGGYAVAPAREAKQSLRETIARKHRP